MVMFWLGKISEKTNDYDGYTSFYEGVINKYPDSYYAYRAYLKLSRITGPLITSYINPKPVVYPYKYSHNNIIVKLVDLKDYDVVNEIAGNDEFIKSWVLYKKGDYSHSMLVARDAMEKIKDKPDKYDLRWRLIYPVLYYDDIQKYASETGNNPPLMLALTREESYFDPLAQSIAGASGLMQLMPSTANEINMVQHDESLLQFIDDINPNENNFVVFHIIGGNAKHRFQIYDGVCLHSITGIFLIANTRCGLVAV